MSDEFILTFIYRIYLYLYPPFNAVEIPDILTRESEGHGLVVPRNRLPPPYGNACVAAWLCKKATSYMASNAREARVGWPRLVSSHLSLSLYLTCLARSHTCVSEQVRVSSSVHDSRRYSAPTDRPTDWLTGDIDNDAGGTPITIAITYSEWVTCPYIRRWRRLSSPQSDYIYIYILLCAATGVIKNAAW